MSEVWRPINDREKRIVNRLLSQDFPGNIALRIQLETARVSTIDPEGSLQFRVTGLPAAVEQRVPIEAYYFDLGMNHRPAVNLLLHVVNGMLHELEVYKDDGSSIATGLSRVDPDDLHFV
ncbi:hypothetical protein HGO38_22870 [Rhizobium sp. CG5]|uniref:DUF6984 family protein n=1 Tax=Rhizobium sp. CG5 TaxID=2726076 RepID=UPI00203333FA|nr:hypothetical protein [Rhizobium sp. CG5]MCM2476311.1 hypothetical protein [Rhizobium sp. CG5]